MYFRFECYNYKFLVLDKFPDVSDFDVTKQFETDNWPNKIHILKFIM